VTDGAGCVGVASVVITEPTQLVSAIGSSTNVACFNQTNGAATMLVNGGTPNYTYTWTPSAQTTSLMVGVGANSYTCNVTDGNGCTTSKSIVISQPSALVIASSSFSNVSCFGGSNGQISTTVQGGTVPIYNYSWTPAQSPSGAFLSGLTAGGYSLTVIDGNNCSVSTNFNISQPSVLTSTYTSLPATCGLINGSATVTVGGGTPSYSVSWNTAPPQTGFIATNMQGGNNWIATIIDAKGCSITQNVVIATPSLPSITGFNATSPSCFGLSNGSIVVNYNLGTAPYIVSWSSPISQTVTTSLLSQTVSGVAAGLYNATVTDNYGCSTSQPVSVLPVNPLILIPSPNATICYGNSTQISASGTGGTPGYTYTWVPNTLTGSGPITVQPLNTTSYVVSLTDANGCISSLHTINVNVTPPLAAVGTSTVLCDGDLATLVPNITSNGNGSPLTYIWNPSISSASTATVIGNASTVPTTTTYSLTIDDGCTFPKGTAVFTVNVNPLPVVDFGIPAVGCAPLSVTLTGVSNGLNDIYTWTNDRSGSLGQGTPSAFATFSDSGKYAITLNVFNPTTGCSNSITKPDFIEVYAQPIASFYANPVQASILDPNIDFVNTSQGATSYYWDFGDPEALSGTNSSTIMNPSHGYSYVGEYKVNLIAISNHGCRSIASQLVEITPDFALYIPNTFTPDGNGLNDVFQPMGVGIDEEDYRLDIYDRWGESIFTSNNFRKGWDGTVKGGSKTAPQGVYTYKMMVKDILGNKHPKIGHVTVIRQNQ